MQKYTKTIEYLILNKKSVKVFLMSFSFNDLSDDLSSFQQQNKQDLVDSTAEDQEIESLEQQISELSSYIDSVQAHSGDRLNRYKQTIEKLQSQVAVAKRRFEEDLENQIEEQNREIRSLIEDYKDELEEILRQAKWVKIDSEKWNEISKTLYDLGDGNKLIDIQKKIAKACSEGAEIELTRDHEIEVKRQDRTFNLQMQQKKVSKLEDDIKHYQTLRRQEDFNYKTVINEFNQSQENREKCHQLTISKLDKEISQRDAIFTKHLSAIQSHLQSEKEKAGKDTTIMKGAEESLIALKNKMISQSRKQIERAMFDIKQIKNQIDQDTESQLSSSLTKIQSVERQNEILKQQIAKLQQQINTIQSNIMKGSIELKKAKAQKDEQPFIKGDRYQRFSYL